MLGGALKRAALLFVTMKFNVCPLSSAGPGLMVEAQARLCAPASSATVWLGPGVKRGVSLTGVTVMTNVTGAEVSAPPLAVPPLSCRRTVTVALPLASGAGVKLNTPVGLTVGGTLNRPAL